ALGEHDVLALERIAIVIAECFGRKDFGRRFSRIDAFVTIGRTVEANERGQKNGPARVETARVVGERGALRRSPNAVGALVTMQRVEGEEVAHAVKVALRRDRSAEWATLGQG